jgi:excisionase family DNA binding protein
MKMLLSVQEAARRLALSEATVYGLCNQRKLRHFRMGMGQGAIRIPEDALDEYLAQTAIPLLRQGDERADSGGKAGQ